MINFEFNNSVKSIGISSSRLSSWLQDVLEDNNKRLGIINYEFLSDELLLEINRKFLNHNYYTDIITFNNSSNENIVSADIYISVDRIKENASTFGSDFEKELLRVLVHGLLHLCGYDDKTEEEQIRMRSREDSYINKFPANVPRETK